MCLQKQHAGFEPGGREFDNRGPPKILLESKAARIVQKLIN